MPPVLRDDDEISNLALEVHRLEQQISELRSSDELPSRPADVVRQSAPRASAQPSAPQTGSWQSWESEPADVKASRDWKSMLREWIVQKPAPKPKYAVQSNVSMPFSGDGFPSYELPMRAAAEDDELTNLALGTGPSTNHDDEMEAMPAGTRRQTSRYQAAARAEEVSEAAPGVSCGRRVCVAIRVVGCVLLLWFVALVAKNFASIEREEEARAREKQDYDNTLASAMAEAVAEVPRDATGSAVLDARTGEDFFGLLQSTRPDTWSGLRGALPASARSARLPPPRPRPRPPPFPPLPPYGPLPPPAPQRPLLVKVGPTSTTHGKHDGRVEESGGGHMGGGDNLPISEGGGAETPTAGVASEGTADEAATSHSSPPPPRTTPPGWPAPPPYDTWAGGLTSAKCDAMLRDDAHLFRRMWAAEPWVQRRCGAWSLPTSRLQLCYLQTPDTAYLCA